MWTEERVAKLKKLWTEGRNGTSIAMELGGVSRNAVIGKAHRLGLARHRDANRPTPRREKAKKQTQHFRTLKMAVNAPSVQKAMAVQRMTPEQWVAKRIELGPKRQVPQPVPQTPASVIGRKTFDDLEPGDCKFPVGDRDFRFCALPRVEGQPYCQSCCQIAFAPRVARQAPAAVPTRQFLQFERA